MKLAEALGVGLEELLEDEREKKQSTQDQQPLQDQSTEIAAPAKSAQFKRVWPLLILSSTLFCIIIAFSYYYFYKIPEFEFAATRILPEQCTKGQPFPVLIQVTSNSSETIALILKENVPKEATVISTSPAVSKNNLKDFQIKWLDKTEGSTVFGYLVEVEGKENLIAEFTGTASILKGTTTPITGNSKIKIGSHHWADSNSDNVISDNEILMVYDYYTDIPGLNLDIDLLEEMWLGAGYSWDEKTGTYIILD